MSVVKSYKIKINKPTEIDWKLLGKLLNDMDYVGYKAKNIATTKLYNFKIESMEHKNRTGKVLDPKALYGMNFDNHIKNQMKKQFEEYGLTDDFYSGCIREAKSGFAGNRFKDILNGNRTLANYRRGGSLPIRATQIKLTSKNTARLTIMNTHKKQELGLSKQNVEVQLITKGQAKVVLDRLLNGEYKLADSKIQKQKKDWFLILSYKVLEVEQVAVDPDKILGIDLGIAKAVAMAVEGEWTTESIEGGEIEHFRNTVEQRRKSIRNQLRVASDNRRGHGRKTLLSPLETLSSKISNFRDLTNHRYSKKIVDTAIKNGCGTIQMEDLTGIKNHSNFLANWSYFDLQTKVEQKAQALGINVSKINPRYTSQRCNKCGVIDKENRKSQALFECSNCGHKANADYNAARNIAVKNIEEIIMEQCVLQGIKY